MDSMDSIVIPPPRRQAPAADWVATNGSPRSPLNKLYAPLSETLQLYAGWLLAWYLLVYALGAYQATRALPFRIPFVEALLPPYSSITLAFAVASFFLLLFHGVYTATGKKRLTGVLLAIIGIAALVLYQQNVY